MAVPIIVAPFLTWVLNRIGFSKAMNKSTYLKTKSETLFYLSQVDTSLLNQQAKNSKEILSQVFTETINQFINENSLQRDMIFSDISALSNFRRTFLLFKPISSKGKVVHFLFFYFLFGLLINPFLYFFQNQLDFQALILFVVFSVVIYFLQRWALNVYKTNLKEIDSNIKRSKNNPLNNDRNM